MYVYEWLPERLGDLKEELHAYPKHFNTTLKQEKLHINFHVRADIYTSGLFLRLVFQAVFYISYIKFNQPDEMVSC